MITADTTIARLLDEHPELVEFLASYHAHFEKLRDRRLRTIMAPRVTVAEAARMAGVAPDELLAALCRAAGVAPAPAASAAAFAADPRPAALAGRRAIDLDVRDDIRRGQEPFARIMGAVMGLGDGEALALRAPFEPIPLYGVLGQRGLAHWTERHADDDWTVWFYREEGTARAAAPAPAAGDASTIDVRGLEPPQPMVRILERLDTLAPGVELEVLHDRRPLFLYPQLDDRGFTHETDEPEPGLVRIRIRREARG